MKREPNPAVDCDRVRQIATSLGLSQFQTGRLYRMLCDSRSIYDDWKIFDALPVLSEQVRSLKQIEQSIRRIAIAERTKAPLNDALRKVAVAGEQWADEKYNATALENDQIKVQRDRLAGHGLRPEKFGDLINYGARQFIERWFAAASIVQELMQQTITDLEAQAEPNKERGAKEWLTGSRLPQLYERFSGKPFTIVKDAEGSNVRAVTGVAFVISVHEAMGLQPPSPNTVAVHVRAAKRNQASG